MRNLRQTTIFRYFYTCNLAAATFVAPKALTFGALFLVFKSYNWIGKFGLLPTIALPSLTENNNGYKILLPVSGVDGGQVAIDGGLNFLHPPLQPGAGEITISIIDRLEFTAR